MLFAIFAIVLAQMGCLAAILSSLIVILSYQYLIAMMLPNTIVIPALDRQTFCGPPEVINNIFNVSFFDNEDIDIIRENYSKSAKMLPKLRYKIKYICGDPYYEEMTSEEYDAKNDLPLTADKELHSYADIDEFLEDNIHEMMPVDGP